MSLGPKIQRALFAALGALASRPALLTLGFAALYLATFDSEMGSPDENRRYDLGVSIARNGLKALKDSGGLSKYPPLQSLLAAPLMKLGLWLDKGADGLWTHRLGLSVSLLACIALIPLFFAVARRLEIPARRAALATALFGITNPVWPYSKRFFSEPLTAALSFAVFAGALFYVRSSRKTPLVVALGCLAILPLNNLILPIVMGLALGAMFLVDERNRLAIIGLGASAAVLAGLLALGFELASETLRGTGLLPLAVLPLANLALLPMGLAFGAMYLFEKRRLAIFGIALSALVGATLVALSYKLRFGTFTNTGYNNETFWFHLIEGLHGLLFGSGRSIFLYAPLTLLSLFGARALWRRSRGAAMAMLVALGAAVLLVANWWCWWGGICWGPRLVLPVLPIAGIGAAALLAEPRRWKAGLALVVGLFGLYVQVLGFSFKHDFDIYFWLAPDGHDERLAWFDWEHSAIRRMPRHYREHPWDLSSSFLTLVQTGPSTVEIGKRPVKRVEITHRGDALIFNWSVTDLFAVVEDAAGTRRIPAGQLGARLDAFNGGGAGALDGNPATRWSSNTKRLDGMWVRLELDRVHDDIVRLELEHMPSERDFPNGLSAKVQGESGAWLDVPAHAATPRLKWNPLIFVFAALGLLFVAASLRRERAPPPEPVPAPPELVPVPEVPPPGN